MKVKMAELTGAALDWAVAMCEGASAYLTDEIALGGEVVLQWTEKFDIPLHHYTPSTDWSQGGPIIEREKLDVCIHKPTHQWCSATQSSVGRFARGYGPTPLIAAMRCYVASNLGDEVDIPGELT